ncbi:MAG: DUF1580 domain-containing protein [Planctomycetaceae bacterium]|nr:DUF1580 domain-containing protein [Planctomycetaceae bacterium]
MDVHIATVWRWSTNGVAGKRLRSIKVGGRRFVLRRDLDEFLDQETKVTAAPTPAAAHSAGATLDSLLS